MSEQSKCDAHGWPGFNCPNCLIDRLQRELATERAAREQAEKQFGTCSVCGFCCWKKRDKTTEECQFCWLQKRAELIEERLSEALDHIRWLQPMAKGYAHSNPVGSNYRITNNADEFLSRTEPSPLLAELEQLRQQLSDEQFARTELARKYHDECAALAQKLKMVTEVFQECPWPEEVWTMTISKYCNVVEDADKRTAISGLMMRKGWEAALKHVNESLAKLKEDQ